MFEQVENCDSILLACVDVDELKRQIAIGQMLSTLSEVERDRANAFRAALLRDRFIAGRFCLREILGNELNIPANEILFSTEANGKPFITNSTTHGGHFSFSRSQQYAVVGYAESNRIGVDTEFVRTLPDMDLMAAEIFDEEQLLEWNTLPQVEKPLSFYRAWTRKEAVVKVDGRGISEGVRKIEVPLGDIATQVVGVTLPPCAPAGETVATTVSLTQWQANEGLVVSVAIEPGSKRRPAAFSDRTAERTGIHHGTAIRRVYFAD